MPTFSKSPMPALVIGLAASLALLAASAGGAADLVALAARVLHAGAAIVWGGLIVFVNVVQLAALAAASEAERATIVRQIVPRTTRLFTVAADATLATGLLLAWPLHRSLSSRPVLVLAIVGGIAMWAVVRFALKPNVARITGAVEATEAQKAEARAAVAFWARVNLALLLPVTLAMIAAAHAGV